MNAPARNSDKAAIKRKAGANQHRTGHSDRFNNYLAHHKLVIRDSLARLLKNPVGSLMTWLVIGIALALPSGLFVAIHNVEAISSNWEGSAQISLYLHKVVSDQDGRQLARELNGHPDIEHVEYISATQALEEFQSLSGYGDVLTHLNSNPLPAVIVVRPVEQNAALESTRQLFAELEHLPRVDQAVLDLEWVQRLYSLMALGKRITLALTALLSLGVLLVIGNTIRLAIESRRDEIVIVKLVGATNAFVRRPFLYTGLWYGLGGGLIAWLLIRIGLLWISGPVAQLTGLYQSQFMLQGLGAGNTLLLWLFSALLGLAGAWLAVSRHLGDIEPR